MTSRTLTVRQHVRSYPLSAMADAMTRVLRCEVAIEMHRAERAADEAAAWLLSLTKAEILGEG